VHPSKDERLHAKAVDQFLLCDFGNVTTFAIFQMCVTSPDCIDELNKWKMGSESANAKSRRIQFGILSGPTNVRILMRESL